MNDEIHAFTDTNVFLHFKPLPEIDWCKLLDAKSIKLVVCLPVIDELDKQKSDSRLSDRAKRALRQIEEHENAGRPLRPGVNLEIYNEPLRSDEFPAGVIPESQDDRIVHMARKYAESHPDLKVCIITDDTGMRLRCRAGGVEAQRMEESDRLENPGDERDKKLKQALNELATYKNRLPKLSITLYPLGQDPREEKPFSCTLTDDWIDLNVEAEVAKQRKLHPKHADRKSSPFGMGTTGIFGSSITPEQWEKYDRDVDSYLVMYEYHVIHTNTWGGNLARTIRFNILLEKKGNVPATDIDLFLVMPKKIAWITQVIGWDARLFRSQQPPDPPKPPSPEFATAIARLGSYSDFAGQMFPSSRDISPIPNPDHPKIRVTLQPEHGHFIHAKLTRLKHGQGIVLGSFLAVVGSWEDVSPFEVEYTISTSELPEKLDGKIPMLVTKMAGPPSAETEDKPDNR